MRNPNKGSSLNNNIDIYNDLFVWWGLKKLVMISENIKNTLNFIPKK